MKNNIYKQILILFFLFLFVQFVGINVTGEELIESSSQVDFYIDPGHGGQNAPDPCGAKTCVFDTEYGFDSCANGYYCENVCESRYVYSFNES